MTGASIVIDVRKVPELVAETRQAMARLLRDEAASEPSSYVRRRLESIAAAFEAGQRPERIKW